MDRLPWGEIIAHVELIYRSRGGQMQWQLAASSFPHTSDASRKDIQGTVNEHLKYEWDADSGTKEKHEAYQRMTDGERVLAVGSSLEHEGFGFLDRRPHHKEWLAEKGMSPEDCRLRYTEWKADKDAQKERRRSGDGETVGDSE